MIDIKTDGHVHTPFCGHATGTMEEYVRKALEKKLAGIVFLEHLERGVSYVERTWLTEENFISYRREATRLKAKYAGRIEVFCGVEVGYNPDCVERLCDFLAGEQWDRIGISYHFLKIGDSHVNLVSRKQGNLEAIRGAGVDRVLQAYYEGLMKAIERIEGHVVCHLDAALRFLRGGRDEKQQDGMIKAVLEKIQERKMALEVNASGFAIRGEQFPATAVVCQAARMGIPLWAGSDAHKPEDVGRFFGRFEALNASISRT
jgi:histidinol-phosphatase (PHP family)